MLPSSKGVTSLLYSTTSPSENLNQIGSSVALSCEVCLTQMVNEPIVGLKFVTESIIPSQQTTDVGVISSLQLHQSLAKIRDDMQSYLHGCKMSEFVIDH
eukprot:TRINITY_DN1287_c0_g1_i6.p3 TRINITY_DN1287_c0_g1~~TRINITY_DN1287_c0_g1_i6.p3  ORF type:complete len:100 (-),score=1.92 TRINITY_DN1287_c0_g1_i6:59-358(-)